MPIKNRSWMDNQISFKVLQEMPYPEKTQSLSWVTSRKIYYKGHVQRLHLIYKLQKAGICNMYGNGFEFVESKISCLKPYKYSIAMENTIDRNYISEKIMDCYLAYAMPFYIGSSEITKYFPEKSMVPLNLGDKFLVDKIKEVSESDLYKERLPYIEEAKQIVLGDIEHIFYTGKEDRGA